GRRSGGRPARGRARGPAPNRTPRRSRSDHRSRRPTPPTPATPPRPRGRNVGGSRPGSTPPRPVALAGTRARQGHRRPVVKLRTYSATDETCLKWQVGAAKSRARRWLQRGGDHLAKPPHALDDRQRWLVREVQPDEVAAVALDEERRARHERDLA